MQVIGQNCSADVRTCLILLWTSYGVAGLVVKPVKISCKGWYGLMYQVSNRSNTEESSLHYQMPMGLRYGTRFFRRYDTLMIDGQGKTICVHVDGVMVTAAIEYTEKPVLSYSQYTHELHTRVKLGENSRVRCYPVNPAGIDLFGSDEERLK